jgi:GNAT superfamily N-acetyltransferase
VVEYALEPQLAAAQFAAVLRACTLGARRPVDDLARLDAMLRQADIIATARHEGRLVGVARAICDFSYSCYLSDLAVDEGFQHQGIGRRLIDETRRAAGEQVMLVLLAAPGAEGYYPKVGLQAHHSAWLIPRKR